MGIYKLWGVVTPFSSAELMEKAMERGREREIERQRQRNRDGICWIYGGDRTNHLMKMQWHDVVSQAERGGYQYKSLYFCQQVKVANQKMWRLNQLKCGYKIPFGDTS